MINRKNITTKYIYNDNEQIDRIYYEIDVHEEINVIDTLNELLSNIDNINDISSIEIIITDCWDKVDFSLYEYLYEMNDGFSYKLKLPKSSILSTLNINVLLEAISGNKIHIAVYFDKEEVKKDRSFEICFGICMTYIVCFILALASIFIPIGMLIGLL